jgi:hypothetical protein
MERENMMGRGEKRKDGGKEGRKGRKGGRKEGRRGEVLRSEVRRKK